MKHTVTLITLKNGAQGLFVYIPDATVMTFDLNFRAGEYLVEEKKWETPHLMEHILLGANKKYPKARLFQAEIEKNGAYSNASTGVYDITYEAECADFEWERVLDLMIVAITKPLFLREEFDAEYGNVHEELRARSNNHFRHLSLAMRQKYGFIAKTDQERLKLMKNVKLKDVREHYERTHTTKNLRFVVGGNITPKREEMLKAMLEGIELPKGRSRLALPDEKPKMQPTPLYIHDGSVKNIYFYLDIFLKRQMNDVETDALGLTSTLLTDTLYSKILGTARERGLVYGMSSGWGRSKLNSGWWFGTQVSRKNAFALFDIMVREIENVRAGKLTKEEIEAAQAYALGRFQRSAQTVGGTAGGYAGRYFFDDKVEDYYQIPKRIKAVTRESIMEIADSFMKEDLWGFGVLGNCGEPFVGELTDRLTPLWARDQKGK